MLVFYFPENSGDNMTRVPGDWPYNRCMVNRTFSLALGDKTLIAEVNDLAGRAHSSVIMRYGETVLLVTAVMAQESKPVDFMPLTVDYDEKFYATGTIRGSRFIRREGRPQDSAILAGRVVDRSIRPLFPDYLRNEVQVVITELSLSQEESDFLAIIGASIALSLAPIPWNGPISAVRIGKTKKGEVILNPDFSFRESPDTHAQLLVAGKDSLVTMIECEAGEAQDNAVIELIAQAMKEIERIQAFQKSVVAAIGKAKVSIAAPELTPEMKTVFERDITPRIAKELFSNQAGDAAIEKLRADWRAACKQASYRDDTASARAFDAAIENAVHLAAVKEGKRVDGRKTDQLRALYTQAGGISSLLHGSGIFYRGETHIFTALTLGGPGDTQTIESPFEGEKRFMHHYNFPPFSTGETGRANSVNRRMIGHGTLAEKALRAVLPPRETFPYTIRLVSEVFSSNGSSSMASICASSLALMDGGVPITRPVVGVGIGVMMLNTSGQPGSYCLLTDIQGPEDHYGDMDFKVAGTEAGITALQLDVKVEGIPLAVLKEAIERSHAPRTLILQTILKTIPAPRTKLSIHAPIIATMTIRPDQIGLVIGGGGKTIKEITEKSGCHISIEDSGIVSISGKQENAEKAKKMIADLVSRDAHAGPRPQPHSH